MTDQPRTTTARAKWWMAGPLVGASAGAVVAMTAAKVEAWSTRSPMLQTAVRYTSHAAGMVSAASTPARDSTPTPTVPSHEEAPKAAAATPSAPASVTVDDTGIWDRPMAQAWPYEREWNDTEEEGYGRFVTAIGRGIATQACLRLDGCLASPTVNPLHDASEVRLGFRPDCADLPYILRAYYAFKRHLPFSFVSVVESSVGGDPRYLNQGIPSHWNDAHEYATPRRFFERMPEIVHSGMFRFSPKVEDSDTYPTRIDRASVRPGTNYYDTNGHVLVVIDVKPNGGIDFIDAHIGGYITYRHFNQTYTAGEGLSLWGGGFRNWRPMRVDNGIVVRDRNWQLEHFDALGQYSPSRFTVAGARVPYHQWVLASLRGE
jgi:hypothetical protein